MKKARLPMSTPETPLHYYLGLDSSQLRRRDSSSASIALAASLILLSASAFADPGPVGPQLGKPVGIAELTMLDWSIYPEGRGLPDGRGTAATGKSIYEAQCRSCHGAEGIGGSGGQLISRGVLTGKEPDPAINNYWPYATTLFDFTRRAMPMAAPGSLSNDEVYALSAYLLNLGGVIGIDDEMNAQSLAQVRMPNRDGFDWVDVRKTGGKPRAIRPGKSARSAGSMTQPVPSASPGS